MENNQKNLIIGADGQLGQSFVQEFKKRGFNFLALTSRQLDITDFHKIESSIKDYKPDYIINCAAYNNVDKAEDEWEQAYLVNGVAIRNLALVANKFNSVLIHYSSDYVFAGDKKTHYTIADTPNPINKYGKSKLLGEVFARDFCNEYYLIRLSSVFGNNPNASFPLKLLSWVKDNKEIKMVDDQFFSPAFVDDIATATIDLIKTGQFGLYHMTNSGYCSRYEWAKYILNKIGWQGKCLPVDSGEIKTLAERPKFSVLDNFPLKNIIGRNLPDWRESTDKFLINGNLI